jgi:hypothetical protein
MADAWAPIDAVYVIANPHYEPGRFERVVQHLKRHSAPEEKIRIAGPTWGKTLSAETCFQVYDPFLSRPFPSLVFKNRALSRGEISLVLNFYSAIKDAHERGHKTIMILESDVKFHHEFGERLAEIHRQLQDKTWDYVSLSDGVGTHAEEFEPNKERYGLWWSTPQTIKSPPTVCTFRCTDSMLLNHEFIEYLYKNLIPFRDCLDWELNYRLYAAQGKAYWAEPHIVEQGTLKGLDVSSLI